MMRRGAAAAAFILVWLGALAPAPLQARAEEWTDTQGNTFRGSAEQMLGPIALFRISPTNCRKVPCHALTAESCRRFFEATKDRPARAEHWRDARSNVTFDLRDRVRRVKDGKLVPAPFGDAPEPEFYVVVFINNSIGDSWGMVSNVTEPFNRLKQAHPDLLEGVSFGLRHTSSEHDNMAVSQNVPWLVTDLSEERRITSLADLAPADGYGLLIVTRSGLPLYGATSPNAETVTKVFAEFADLLTLLDADNPQTWPDRAYYEKIVQPLRYASGEAAPVLLGNPLRAEGLRQRQVTLVEAHMMIAADGTIGDVTVRPDGGVPLNLVAPIAAALKQACVFVPAVKDGRFVAGTYDYRLAVSP